MGKLVCIMFAALAASAFADKVTDRLKASNRGYSREVRVDYDSCPGKVVHWYADGHAKTNTPRRVDLVVQTNTVELLVVKTKKVEKAAEKARKKDQKNFEKWVKDTEKARDKSSSDMAEFYDSILEIAKGKEEAK